MSMIFEIAGAAVIFGCIAVGRTWWTTTALVLVGTAFLIKGVMELVRLKRGDSK